MDVRSPFYQCLAMSLAGILFLNPIVSAAAQLSVDPASPGTSIGHAPNGVPVVNIAGPNGSGLSHNLFTDYNVGSNGLILNNATQAAQNTQLGGVILGNPGLQGRPASVILNEVTGGNRSHLGGYTEVAGHAARVIVANPHGITCNGCGFINTPRATLTTGKPVLEGGRLEHFRVEGGDIALEGAGLNARNVSQFDLITRTAKLNAQLHADQLNIITGRNDVSADGTQVRALADDGRSKPQLAIDSSALGGMYAGAIRLIGTEAGVGVRVATEMASTAGDLFIQVNGGLSLAHTTSTGALSAKAASIELQGPTFAVGDVDLKADADLVVKHTLASAGNVQVHAATVSNEGKIVSGINEDRRIAGKQLDITAERLDNKGELNASGHLGIRAATVDNTGTIAANSAKIDARQHVKNSGQVVTAQALTVAAKQLDNAGTLHTESDLSVVAETVDNSGKVVAANELNVAARDLTNSGELLSDNHLQLHIDGDLKNTGLIAAKGNADIRASSLIQDRGQVLGGQDIQLRIREVLHNLGVLSAARHMQINAAQLNNHGTLGSQGNLLLTANVTNTGLLFSGGDMHIRGEHFSNLEGNVYSVGDFSFAAADGSRASTFKNLSGTLETEGNLHINAHAFENARTHLTLERELVGGTIQWVCGQHCDGDDSFKRGTIYITETWRETAAPGSTKAASLIAGKNLSISADTLQNRYSLLAANGDMHLTARSLVNQGAASQTGTSSTIIGTPGRIDKALWDRMEFVDLPAFHNAPFDPVRFAELKARSSGAGFSNPGTLTTWREDGRELYAATLQAGGSLTLQASEYLQNGTLRENTLAQLIGEIGHNPNDLELSPDRLSDDLTRPPEFQLPSGEYGLFIPSKNPGSPYLIETNPLFTHLANFLSSQYLLDKIGYNTDEAWRRLGDGYYESRLIRDAVLAKTGQRFLAGLDSDEAQFRYLMDNGLSARDSLQLSVGVGLTAQQVAALTHDIVWMEKRQVQGEDVLVPVLYLATVDTNNLRGGSLVQGRDINLVSGGDIVSVGTLKAAQNVAVIADGSLLNGGSITAGERISLLATDSIRNAMAGEIRASNVELTSITGDIVNERTAQAKRQGDGTLITYLDNASQISAGQQLTLNAGRDITNRGDIHSGGNASLTAARDINLIAVTDTQQIRTTENGGHRVTQTSTTEHLGANVNAAGNLSLKAGGDITLLASQANAGKDLTVAAGGDIYLLAAANETDHEINSKRSGAKIHEQTTQVRQVGSQLNAGGDLTATAGQNILLQASQVTSGKDAYLIAGGQLQLLSANDSDYSLYDYEKKGSFGAIKTQRDEVTDVKAVGSQISTGGNLNLISGGDQLYQGANLQSGADITITSGGSVTFEAVKDLHQESHEKSKSDLAWMSMKGEGRTDETLRQTEIIAQGKLAIQAVEGLRIDIKEINQATVGQTIDAMVKGDPKLAWIKEAEQRGDVDWRRVKELHDSYKYSHSGMGQGAMLAVIIVMSLITAGAASSLAVAAGGGTLGSMAGATFQAVASQTAVSTINNKGNLGAAFKEVTSSGSLKGYATSALTAGFSTGVIDPAFGVTGDRVNNITKGFDLASASDIAKFAAYSGAQGAAQAGFKTLVQGGSLKDNLNLALSSQLQSTLQAIAFNAVGDFSESQNWPESSPEKVALHALVGGLLSEANGGSFATGALAAGANEALISSLAQAVEGNPALMLAASQLVGLAAAGATEGDVQKGAELAKNATAYNYLNHHEVDDLVNDLKGCRGAANPTACRADLTLKYESISDQKTGMHLMLCSDLGSCEAQRTAVELGNAALDQYEGNGGLSWEERLIVRGFQGSNQDDTRLAVQKTVQGSHAEMLSMLPGVGLVVGKGGGVGTNLLGADGTPATKAALQVPGRVQSRVNLRNGSQSEGAGWNHLTNEHYSAVKNKSQFTIPQDELRQILQSKEVVGTPVTKLLSSANGPRYVREVDVGRNIGTDKFNNFAPATKISVLTDRAGNLVSAFPGVLK